MKPSLKWPLVLAAVLTVVRVPIELSAAPGWVAMSFSVVALYVLIFPVSFALQIARSDSARPYRDQLRSTALYAALCRAMLIPVYWLSYLFQWKAQRFQLRGGGVVGGTPTYAFLFPFGQLIFWTLVALVVGGGIGCGIIAIKRRAGLKRRGRAEAVSSRDSR
jgi:hypothetical protein